MSSLPSSSTDVLTINLIQTALNTNRELVISHQLEINALKKELQQPRIQELQQQLTDQSIQGDLRFNQLTQEINELREANRIITEELEQVKKTIGDVKNHVMQGFIIGQLLLHDKTMNRSIDDAITVFNCLHEWELFMNPDSKDPEFIVEKDSLEKTYRRLSLLLHGDKLPECIQTTVNSKLPFQIINRCKDRLRGYLELPLSPPSPPPDSSYHPTHWERTILRLVIQSMGLGISYLSMTNTQQQRVTQQIKSFTTHDTTTLLSLDLEQFIHVYEEIRQDMVYEDTKKRTEREEVQVESDEEEEESEEPKRKRGRPPGSKNKKRRRRTTG